MLAQHRRRGPTITSALGRCLMLSGVSGAGMTSVTPIIQQSENLVQSPNAVSMTGQCQRLWVNIETALGECIDKVYSRPSDELVLRHRRRRLTAIEPAIGCDAGPTLNRNMVGRSTSSVRGTS